MSDSVGLLALQGDFELHRRALAGLGVETRLVRRPAELADCAALVFPGGESTTLARLIDRVGLRESIIEFARRRPVLGTCAGLILLARELTPEVRGDHGVIPFGLLDCVVQRNGFGRQVDSFSEPISLDAINGSGDPFLAVFIRAPRILDLGPDVEVLARRDDEPIVIRQGNVLGMTFHPELAGDLRLHAAFCRLAGVS